MWLAAGMVAIAVVYVGSYSVNSALGGYWLKPERDGLHGWSSGHSMHTAILWQPAYGYSARYKSDWIGTLFSPLVSIDRRWFHPTMYVTDDATFEWIKYKARPSDIHSRWRAEFRESVAPMTFSRR